jgi:uncharacterized membrane protein
MAQEPINPEEPVFNETEPQVEEITSDDKLWALLAYIFAPWVSIILMLMEDKKDRPFIKYHNAQALILGIAIIALSIVLGATVVGLCVPVVLWIVMIYWGIQAYNGEYVEIPFVTKFAKDQGWM